MPFKLCKLEGHHAQQRIFSVAHLIHFQLALPMPTLQFPSPEGLWRHSISSQSATPFLEPPRWRHSALANQGVVPNWKWVPLRAVIGRAARRVGDRGGDWLRRPWFPFILHFSLVYWTTLSPCEAAEREDNSRLNSYFCFARATRFKSARKCLTPAGHGDTSCVDASDGNGSKRSWQRRYFGTSEGSRSHFKVDMMCGLRSLFAVTWHLRGARWLLLAIWRYAFATWYA